MFEKLFMWLRLPKGHKLYSGNYRDGVAVYSYYEKDRVRIYNGAFSFRQKKYRVDGVSKYHVKGFFVEGMKSGTWYYRHKNHELNNKLIVDMSNGHFEGQFYYWERRFGIAGCCSENSVSMEIRDGHVTGIVEGQVDSQPFRGTFNELGEPDGLFELTRSDKTLICETWEQGTLVEVSERNGTSKKILELKSQVLPPLRYILNNDCRYLFMMVKHGSSETVMPL